MFEPRDSESLAREMNSHRRGGLYLLLGFAMFPIILVSERVGLPGNWIMFVYVPLLLWSFGLAMGDMLGINTPRAHPKQARIALVVLVALVLFTVIEVAAIELSTPALKWVSSSLVPITMLWSLRIAFARSV